MDVVLVVVVGAVTIGLVLGEPWAAKGAERFLPYTLDPETCPESYRNKNPLILISMDGFRTEYLNRGLTPTIQALSNRGVHAPFMKPSYPTITFPNHYTIVTGLIPPAHGIIANHFYDSEFGTGFTIRNASGREARWYTGEPIWKTAEKQELFAAPHFCPPTQSVTPQPPFHSALHVAAALVARKRDVLAWLDLPEEQRPEFLTLYMHEPDDSGHDFGPHSPELEEALVHVDNMILMLLEGLQQRNILHCVNLLVVADHGMAEAGDSRVIRVDDFVPQLQNTTRPHFWSGVFSRIQTDEKSQDSNTAAIVDALSCKRHEMRVYQKELMPVRWHIGNHTRVEPVVLDLDAGWTVGVSDAYKADPGDHGYDNYFAVMNALFLAHGPAFRRNVELESFQNIELYNLMCQVLGLIPAPNNGTWGALHHALVNPPKPPASKIEPLLQVASFSDESVEELSQCEGDQNIQSDWLERLKDDQDDILNHIANNVPWGIPQHGNLYSSTLMLSQKDHITGYSTLVKQPLWSSYTISSGRMGKVYSNTAPWTSDLRIPSTYSPSCPIYDSVTAYNVTRHPLFPPEFAWGNIRASYLISNAVPVTTQLAERWHQLRQYVATWAETYGALNVISGPVFDYDADTFVDNLHDLRYSKGGLKVPTHMFLVASRCFRWVAHPRDCPIHLLDTIAFVLPQYMPTDNCLSPEQYLVEFSAKISDVEKITGLKFFQDLHYEDRVRLQTRIHSNLWGQESWWNRIKTDLFGYNK
ncbi:unnamed protein product, partial [Meganyctiphanes norvegica]